MNTFIKNSTSIQKDEKWNLINYQPIQFVVETVTDDVPVILLPSLENDSSPITLIFGMSKNSESDLAKIMAGSELDTINGIVEVDGIVFTKDSNSILTFVYNGGSYKNWTLSIVSTLSNAAQASGKFHIEQKATNDPTAKSYPHQLNGLNPPTCTRLGVGQSKISFDQRIRQMSEKGYFQVTVTNGFSVIVMDYPSDPYSLLVQSKNDAGVPTDGYNFNLEVIVVY